MLFLATMLFAMTARFLHQMGLTRITLSFGVAWLMCFGWIVALHHPAFYAAHRLRIVLLGRALMAVSANLATSGVREQLYKTLMFDSAALSLVFKMFLFCNTGQMPVESVRLQLPFCWQMIGTGSKALLLLMSEFTTEFVSFCNTPRYLAALTTTNRLWGILVQSGAPIPLPASSQLSGRSGSALLALTTLWVTDVMLIGYLCYVSLWSDMRLWLASKAQDTATRQRQGGQQDEALEINGVVLSYTQLQSLFQTPFAMLMNGRGMVGGSAMVLLHLGIINLLCMVSWLISQLLVLQLLPRLLPESVFDVVFQELPAAGADSTCSVAGTCPA